MNQLKIKPWVWFVIAAVIAGGLGFGLWYYNYKVLGSSSSQTIPSSLKSLGVLSPSAGITTTPSRASQTDTGSQTTGGQTSEPSTTNQTENQSIPQAGTKNYTGPVSTQGQACNPSVSFNYPANYNTEYFGGSPSTPGWIYINASDGDRIRIDAPALQRGDWTITCKSYENLMAVYNDFIIGQNASQPQSMTINGLQAIQWTMNNQKITVIQNSNYSDLYVSIRLENSTSSSAYDTIVNSMQFK